MILFTLLILFVFSISFLWDLEETQKAENLLAGMEMQKLRSLFSIQLYQRVSEILEERNGTINFSEIAINDSKILLKPEGVTFVKGE